MKKDRVLLEKELYIILEKYNQSKILDAVDKDLVKLGIKVGNSIFQKKIPLESLDLKIVGVLTSVFYNNIEENKEIINPSKWFTDLELKEIEKFHAEEPKKGGYPIKFEKVVKVHEDFYSCYLTAQEVKNLYDKHLVKYNSETQRNMKVLETKDGIVETISLNRNSVNEIKTVIKSGDFITNNITLNLLQDGNDDLGYNEKTGTLIIKSGELNILDGFHRSVSMIEAVAEDHDLIYITGVNITNFNVEKARKYIVQEDKKNKISEEYIKTISESLENLIVKTINESNKSDLKNKITHNDILIKNNKAIINFNLLANAIKEVYNVKTRRDALKLTDWLINGLNEVLHIVKDEPNLIQSNMFAVYIDMIKRVQGKSKWENELNDLINSINSHTIEQIISSKLNVKKIIKLASS